MELHLRTFLAGITTVIFGCAVCAQAQTPAFTSASVVNAASMAAGPIAPGMLANISGTNLGSDKFTSCIDPNGSVPTVCNGVSVLVNGQAAPVVYTSATQLRFQVPFNLTGTTANIQVTRQVDTQTYQSAVVGMTVAPTAPGLFSTSGTGIGKGYYYDTSSGGFAVVFSTAVLPGDTVILYGTGFGVTNPAIASGTAASIPLPACVASVTMTVGSQSVAVQSTTLEARVPAGGTPGSNQVVFAVPAGLAAGDYPMVVTVGGVASHAVNLTVAAAPPKVTSISPSAVPVSASPQTVLINGTGFQNGATVRVAPPIGSYVQASNVTFVNSTQLSAQITVGTQPGSGWILQVINPDGGATLFSFSVTTAAPVATITSIVVTSSHAPVIAQNTWIEIYGTNLADAAQIAGASCNHVASGCDWGLADFSHGLPTSLAGVSATVNNKPAAVFYVSPTQVNILAPLDSATGSVPVQVTTPNGSSAAVTATELATAPAFLVLDIAGHVAARHVDFSLLGPASQLPLGAFTPAKPGELVLLYCTGFGQTNPPITNQLTGSGSLPILPTVTIGGLPAQVQGAALSGPGLYQVNVVVPANAPDGDLTLLATYNGLGTQSGAVISVQH